jgi:hypothetical protein
VPTTFGWLLRRPLGRLLGVGWRIQIGCPSEGDEKWTASTRVLAHLLQTPKTSRPIKGLSPQPCPLVYCNCKRVRIFKVGGLSECDSERESLKLLVSMTIRRRVRSEGGLSTDVLSANKRGAGAPDLKWSDMMQLYEQMVK